MSENELIFKKYSGFMLPSMKFVLKKRSWEIFIKKGVEFSMEGEMA